MSSDGSSSMLRNTPRLEDSDSVGAAMTCCDRAIARSTAPDSHCMRLGSGDNAPRIHTWSPRRTCHRPGPGRRPVTSTASRSTTGAAGDGADGGGGCCAAAGAANASNIAAPMPLNAFAKGSAALSRDVARRCRSGAVRGC
ncbi:hypothetical protein Y886_14490 [Xanthomonas hyacinthi DSM 19077]|nr:hypothetical protein Y886_14490 [Xanthomonas hyacinthi DSM 19077]